MLPVGPTYSNVAGINSPFGNDWPGCGGVTFPDTIGGGCSLLNGLGGTAPVILGALSKDKPALSDGGGGGCLFLASFSLSFISCLRFSNSRSPIFSAHL